MVRPTPPTSAELLGRQWLLDLVSAYTPAGREAGNLPVLLPILEALGASVELREPEPGRVNVLATWGEPRVLFSTHLDVVPGELPVREAEGIVHGRGSCDAKGQAVAQLLAVRELLASGRTGLAWLGLCGEETDSLGARDALAWAPRFARCRALINGEPTELKCATGQRGVLHLRLCCAGTAAHSGSPELGRSATFALLDWLEALRRAPSPRDPDLGPEVWNLGLLRGGTATNVIPEAAEADLLVRTVPGSRFKALAEASRPADARLEVRLEEPWDRYPDLPGFEMAPMPFGSDAPQLRDLIPDRTVVLAGPGTIRVAHTDHEHLALADLMAGAELNRRLALHVLEDLP
jgi:acetylornithine deacetylase